MTTNDEIIAISEEGEGLLPMKKGKEQELKKSSERRNIEVCNFIKNAFVVDGKVELVKGKEIKTKVWFKATDKERGTFWVAYGDLK